MKTHQRHVHTVRSMAETECGVCCCCMILRYYKNTEDLATVQDTLMAGRDGVSVRQMVAYLRSKGLLTRVSSNMSLEEMGEIEGPGIAFVSQSHFVVVEKVKRNHVVVYDPAYGKRKIDKETFKTTFSGIFIEVCPSKEYVPAKGERLSIWKYVFGIMMEKWYIFLAMLVLTGVVYYFGIKIPVLMQQVIDQSIYKQDVNFINRFISLIPIGIVLYAGIFLLRCFLLLAANLFLGERLEVGTFRTLLGLPYRYFENRSTGDIYQRLSSTTSIKEIFAIQVVGALMDIGGMIVYFAYMLTCSVKLTILALAIMIINVSLMIIMRPHLAMATEEELLERSLGQGIQIEALYSINAVKSAAMEDSVFDKWNGKYRDIVKKYKRRIWYGNLGQIVSQTSYMFGPFLLILLGLKESFNGVLTIGTTISFYAIVGSFFGYSNSISGMVSQVIMLNGYLDRLGEIWRNEKKAVKKEVKEMKIRGNVTFENVSFQYSPNSAMALNSVSFSIKKGQKAAFVGMSGSGKTTMSKVLLGLYEPTSGKVYIDGEDIDEIDRKSFCGQIGTVPQESMLFNKSILENIRMEGNYTEEEVKEAAKMACIHDEIMQMPMKYNTLVSEMGMNLSGGQRQRILLARALVTKPKIMLLDEATSSLDTINEFKIMEWLKEKGCTRIVIAHRMSTVVDADVIFVMSEGRIVAKGTHEQLMKESPQYRELYSKVI